MTGRSTFPDTVPERSTPYWSRLVWELATNVRWAWRPDVQALFRYMHPDTWDHCRNPVQVLRGLGTRRWLALMQDQEFLDAVETVYKELQGYLTGTTWWDHQGAPGNTRMLYLSPEFGLTETIAQYSGGLGVLAGCTLKGFSDDGIPVIGMGLRYRQGYFSQTLSFGRQNEEYWDQDPGDNALELQTAPYGAPLLVAVPVSDRTLHAQIWKIQVGRVPLYLLDANVPENDPDLRDITDRLYGGDNWHRFLQLLLLGAGGVQAAGLLGLAPTVYHLNDPHAAFAALERIRMLVGQGLSGYQALEDVREGTIFTTHTPVPAGMDRFPQEWIRDQFWRWSDETGIPLTTLFDWGNFPGDHGLFNMAALGVRLAGRVNGVSRLHGQVSNDLFAEVRGDKAITSVTNGVHGPSWVSPSMQSLLEAYVGSDWATDGQPWDGVYEIPASRLWATRQEGRAELVDFVRRYRRQQCIREGWTADIEWTDQLLDPNVLTVGFARRVAMYKRLRLLLSQPERLRRLLLDSERPVQFVFAGKAHPRDEGAKAVLEEFVQFVLQTDIRHRIVFLPDYNIRVAQLLVWGCDVWLNTPEWGREASGTSGEKSVLNGGRPLSVPDGWYYEMHSAEQDTGWAIGPAEVLPDDVVADILFDLLEGPVRDRFYERDEQGLPQGWIDGLRHTLATLGPQVLVSRMVRDYARDLYLPASRQVSTHERRVAR